MKIIRTTSENLDFRNLVKKTGCLPSDERWQRLVYLPIALSPYKVITVLVATATILSSLLVISQM